MGFLRNDKLDFDQNCVKELKQHFIPKKIPTIASREGSKY